MSKHLANSDDERYIMQMARQMDESGEERARKEAEIRHDKELVDAKHREDSALH